MRTIQTLLLVLLLCTISFFAKGQSYDQTIVQLPKRLAKQTNCLVTLINLESRQKFTYLTTFTEHPVINLAAYPSGKIYYYSVKMKGEIVNEGNFFYPLQVNNQKTEATVSLD